MIGGNLLAVIQTKRSSTNEIGEAESIWTDSLALNGWLDLSGGDSKYTTYNAKVQESTHIFICDYQVLDGITSENARMVIDGYIYDIMLIDDPMSTHQQIEIYLKYTGGQYG